MKMLFTLAYLPSMNPIQIKYQSNMWLGPDKYFLKYLSRNNCITRQTDLEHIGHE